MNTDEPIEWHPVWTGAELDHFNSLRGELAPQISLIRQIREEFDVSQKDLADILGVTQSNISKIENRNDIKLSSLVRIVGSRGAYLTISIETPAGRKIEYQFRP